MTFKFEREDTGNCRTYYRSSASKRLYCIQNEGRFGVNAYVFYGCSQDGEPSSEMRMPTEDKFDKVVLPVALAKGEKQ
jgi:hypothetical protein